MRLLAIDPGPSACGAVWLVDGELEASTSAIGRAAVTATIYTRYVDEVVIEMVVSYGMPIGKTTMETLVTIGRIEEACRRSKIKCHRLTRPEVCIELCGSTRAKQANVRQATRDLYPATGEGKYPEVGTKAKPGPLYGIKSHAWEALALGVVWLRKRPLRAPGE
ncbi:MAG: hypothetical protein ACYTBJ_02310 [Planctomycetota bacterium]|jgi:hypothetical protein